MKRMAEKIAFHPP